MIIPFFFLLPLVALVVPLIIFRTFRESRRARWMIRGSVVAALGIGALYLWAIFHSTSSTAAIGILFVPLAMAAAMPAGAGLGWMVHEASHRRSSVAGVASMLGLAGVLLVAGMQGYRVMMFQQMRTEQKGETLAKTARSKLQQRDYFVLSAIAANEHTPEDVLLEIAEHPDPGLHEKRSEWIDSFDGDQLAVARKVIRNRRTPLAALVKLAESKNEYVLGDVAQEKRTPVEVLRKVAEAEHGYLVNWGLAVNPSTPVEILERLPYEKDIAVAQNLARNPSTPVTLLEKFAGHRDAMVRGSVAGNVSAPESVLRGLSRDPEAWVARQAERQLKRLR